MCVSPKVCTKSPGARLQLCAIIIVNRAYEAIGKALSVVKKTGNLEIPPHLKNAPTDFLKSQGHSAGYKYPHDDPSYKQLTYLPSELKGRKFYNPGQNGVEAKFKHILAESRPNID